METKPCIYERPSYASRLGDKWRELLSLGPTKVLLLLLSILTLGSAYSSSQLAQTPDALAGITAPYDATCAYLIIEPEKNDYNSVGKDKDDIETLVTTSQGVFRYAGEFHGTSGIYVYVNQSYVKQIFVGPLAGLASCPSEEDLKAKPFFPVGFQVFALICLLGVLSSLALTLLLAMFWL